jgi:hypothetical protein
MTRGPWHADENWTFRPLDGGSGVLSVPHPSRAGLQIDADRPLVVRSAALGYAVFAYGDEATQPYRNGEYQIPTRLFVLWRDAPLLPAPAALELLFERRRWVCQQLVIVRSKLDPPITNTTLRRIKFDDIATVVTAWAADKLVPKRGGGLHRVSVILQESTASYHAIASTLPDLATRGKRATDRHLLEVAAVYLRAKATGRRDTTIAVMEAFSLERSAASRRIAEAREREFIPRRQSSP